MEMILPGRIETDVIGINVAPDMSYDIAGAKGFVFYADSTLLGGSLVLGNINSALAPTITTAGTAGTTAYTYFVIANTAYGKTVAGAGGSITTANATLDTTNYNIIQWSLVNGATSYDVIRVAGASAAVPSGTGTYLVGSTTNTYINDQSNTLTSYTVPSIGNSNGILKFGTDTGLSRGAAGTVYVGNGNSGDVTGTLVAGLLGIGQTSPIATLDIISPNNTADNTNESTAGIHAIRITTGTATGDQTLLIGTDKNNHLSYLQSVNFGTAKDTLVLNPAGGNVGIGTTSPSYNLEVMGTSGLSAFITATRPTVGSIFISAPAGSQSAGTVGVVNATGGSANAIAIVANNGGGYFEGSVGIGLAAAYTTFNVASIALGGTNGYGLQVNAPTGATNNYAATFLGGNVGIGTTNPDVSLTITAPTANGSDAFHLYDSNGALRTTLNEHGMQTWVLNNGSAEAGSLSYSTPGGLPGIVFFNASGTGRSQMSLLNSSGGLGFSASTTNVGAATQLSLTTAGYVGIGTSSPGALLDVNGAATATSSANGNSGSIYITGSYWNGTTAASDIWSIRNVLGSGSNPYSTLTIAHSGSSGGALISTPNSFSLTSPTATSSTNYNSPTLTLEGNYWNGTSANALYWSLFAQVGSGTSPYTQLLISPPSNAPGTASIQLGALGTATSTSGNYNSTNLDLQGTYWTGAGAGYASWSISNTMGTGTTPDTVLWLTPPTTGGGHSYVRIDAGTTGLQWGNDTTLFRTAAGNLSLGTGTVGDHSGTLTLGTLYNSGPIYNIGGIQSTGKSALNANMGAPSLRVGGTAGSAGNFGAVDALGVLQLTAGTLTTSAAAATIPVAGINSFAVPTLASSPNTQTLTVASTLYVDGPPVAGSNVTIGTPLSFYVKTGSSSFGGNLGIGNTSPSQLLSVGSSNPFTVDGLGQIKTVSSGSSPFTIQNSTPVNLFTVDSGGNVWANGTLSVAGTSSSYFSGNVGIGTTAPVTTLQVAGNYAGSNPALNSAGQLQITGASNGTIRLGFGIDTSNLVGQVQAWHVGGASYPLSLQPSGGYVGIGTTSPTTRLTVGDGASQNTLKVWGSSATDAAPVLSLFRVGARESVIAQDNHGLLFANTSGLANYADATLLTASASTGMYLSNSGYFGIGTTSPAATLDVNGSTTATSSANGSSGSMRLTGSYWNGTAAANDYWSLQNVLGTGTNPTSTLNITHSGSSGSYTVFVPSLSVNSTTVSTASAMRVVGGGSSANKVLSASRYGTGQGTGGALFAGYFGAGTESSPLPPSVGDDANGYAFFAVNNANSYSATPNFAIRHTITALGSGLDSVDTSFMSNSTSTGVPFASMTLQGQSGWVGVMNTSPSSALDLGNNGNTATSSNNYSSGVFSLTGSYWNGSASAADHWTLQNVLGTGTNPTSSLTIGHAGSTGTGTVNLNATTNIEIDAAGIQTLLSLTNKNSSNSVQGESIAFTGYYKEAVITASFNPVTSYGGVLSLQTYNSSNTLNTGIVLDQHGNVGIGTSTPAQTLYVVGDIQSNGDTSGAGLSSGLTISGDNARTTLPANDVSSYVINTITSSGSYPFNGTGNLVLQPRTSAARDIVLATGNGTPTPRLVVQSTGNVGIGTSSPSAALDVEASSPSIYVKATSATLGGYLSSSASGTFLTSNVNPFTAYLDDTTKPAWLLGCNTGSDTFAVNRYSAGTNPRTAANFLTILNSGNVGIGIASPSYPLVVNGRSEVQYTDGTSNVSLTPTSTGGVINVRNSSGVSVISLDARGTNSSYFSGGNVGIGTTTPSSLLHVYNGTTDAKFLVQTVADAQARIDLKNVTNNWSLLNDSSGGNGAGKLSILNGSSSRLVIDTSGNVGIGTTSPAYPLDIAGTGTVISVGTSNSVNQSSAISFSARATFGYDSGGSYNGYQSVAQVAAATGKGMEFQVNGSTTPVMFITPTGNVGIGTTAPTSLFDVAGTSNVTGNLTVMQVATPTNGTFTTATTGGTLAPGTYYYRVAALNSAGTSLASAETSIVVPTGTSTNTVTVKWNTVPDATSYNVYGRTTGAELLMASAVTGTSWTDTGSVTPAGALPSSNTTGFVGIGTTTPVYTLDVTGTMNATTIRENGVPLATVATSGSYTDLTNAPTIYDGGTF